jgi:exopolyphosphatase/pppGpp-phosphohydrolase
MKGDRVTIVVDVGGGSAREFEIAATKAGRRVEVSLSRGTVEVSEVTRSGQPVRSARFMAARVVALVEHPAPVGGERTPRRPPPAEPLSLALEEEHG